MTRDELVARVHAALVERSGRVVPVEELAAIVYAERLDGGPLHASSCIRSQLCCARRAEHPLAAQIRGIGGHGGGLYLAQDEAEPVRLVDEIVAVVRRRRTTTAGEVAAVLGTSAGTIRSTLYTARRRGHRGALRIASSVSHYGGYTYVGEARP